MFIFPRSRRIYADNNATTTISRSVVNTMTEVYEKYYGNPSSLHIEGQQAKSILEQSRTRIAHFFDVPPNSIIFTSCGTESNNIAIRNVMGVPDKHKIVLTSKFEHGSVDSTVATYKNIKIPVTYDGYLDLNAFQDALYTYGTDIKLITLIMGQNEVGTIQPIATISKIIKQVLGENIIFHIDATQIIGKYKNIYPVVLGVDMMTASAHKFHGPRGVGILYANEKAREAMNKSVTMCMSGGNQEFGFRSGTENVTGIVGTVAALEIALTNLSEKQKRIRQIRDAILECLIKIPGVTVNGDPQRGLYNTLNVSLPGITGKEMVRRLDSVGIAIGSGSACKRGLPSPVLTVMGRSEAECSNSIRISLSDENTLQDGLKICREIRKII